jgi:hypothetical protein
MLHRETLPQKKKKKKSEHLSLCLVYIVYIWKRFDMHNTVQNFKK